MLVVPRAPEVLRLEIARTWDGRAPADPRLRGRLTLSAEDGGLRFAARLEAPGAARIPDAPEGSRVPGLWNWDVVEGFLVGADGRYLEVELGAGGHFLVLSFADVRRRSEDHEALRPAVEHARDASGWRTALTLPWRCVPPEVCALNAFAIVGGVHLAFSSVPGPAPDFHQPARFPAARVAPSQ